MKFGVIIRSIGERTEKLCYESVKQYIPDENINLLRNYYPSYKAFLKMFKIAKKEKYDWFLGLDADVILKENWFDLFKSKIENNQCDNIFRVHFYVKDGITGNNLVRGNNFYNGKYLKLSKKYLKENIIIGRFWFYYKNKGFNTGYFTKPESAIRTHFREKLNIPDKTFEETVGYHSYEQYYSEIFRQYITRRKREPEYINKSGNGFLSLENQGGLLKENKLEQYVANIAWNDFEKFKIKHIDGRIRNKIIRYLIDKYNILENQSVDFNLADFYEKVK